MSHFDHLPATRAEVTNQMPIKLTSGGCKNPGAGTSSLLSNQEIFQQASTRSVSPTLTPSSRKIASLYAPGLPNTPIPTAEMHYGQHLRQALASGEQAVKQSCRGPQPVNGPQQPLNQRFPFQTPQPLQVTVLSRLLTEHHQVHYLSRSQYLLGFLGTRLVTECL